MIFYRFLVLLADHQTSDRLILGGFHRQARDSTHILPPFRTRPPACDLVLGLMEARIDEGVSEVEMTLVWFLTKSAFQYRRIGKPLFRGPFRT
jgi:hypothetical protein